MLFDRRGHSGRRPALPAKVSFRAVREPPALCHDLGNPLFGGDEKLLLFRAHSQRRARQGLFRSGAGNEHLRNAVTAAFCAVQVDAYGRLLGRQSSKKNSARASPIRPSIAPSSLRIRSSRGSCGRACVIENDALNTPSPPGLTIALATSLLPWTSIENGVPKISFEKPNTICACQRPAGRWKYGP